MAHGIFQPKLAILYRIISVTDFSGQGLIRYGPRGGGGGVKQAVSKQAVSVGGIPERRIRCRFVADGRLPNGERRRPGFLLSRGCRPARRHSAGPVGDHCSTVSRPI